MSAASRSLGRARRARQPLDPARRLVPLIGMLVLVFGAFVLMVWLTTDPERRAAVQGLIGSPFGLVVLFALSALSTATLILPAPGLALTAVAGGSGDPILVGVVAGLGQAAGELTGYFAGRSGSSFLPDNAATKRVTAWLERRGAAVVFVLAVIPNPVFDVAGIAAGAMRMGLGRYLAAAAAGKVIKNVVIAGGASSIGALLGVLLLTG